MPKGTAEWFGARYGYGSIVRKGGGADSSFGIATVRRGLGSLNESQRLASDVTRDKGRRFNLRAAD